MSPRRRRMPLNQRGVALLIVIVAIAILTAVATDFAYNSRVDLTLATNQRDEVRAYYLARSGIGLARLVLKFQKQLDSTPIPNLGGLMSLLNPTSSKTTPPALGTGATSGASPLAAPASLNLQIWKMARVDCHMLQGLVKSEGEQLKAGDGKLRASTGKFDFDREFPEIASAQSKRSFGGFQGCFLATITDEEQRINLNKLDAPGMSAQAPALQLLTLLGDKRFEFLFAREDSNRVKVTPQELVLAMHDWIDDDELGATLNLTGQGTNIFLPGFQDENYNYDRYTPRYKAKNARFDSLDEIYMVHGVNDRFMAAFGDRLTVFPDVNRNLNINSDDPMMLYTAILAVSDPLHPDSRLANPLFVEQLIKQIRSVRSFSFMGMGVADFVNLVAAQGIAVNQTISQNVANNRFISDKSETFRITAVGEAGTVQKTITAVVRLDNQLGKLLYWREE